MRHGSVARFGRFTGDGQNPRDLFGGELARRTAPGSIAQQFRDRHRQRGRLLAAFDQNQALERIGPAVPPRTDRMTLAPDVLRDVLIGETVESQEDHPDPLGNGLGTGAGTNHGAQGILLPFRDDKLARPPRHRSDSW
jgi:hypothetical protein